MAELLALIAARAGWAIPVAVVLWFVARRLTSIVPASQVAPEPPAREARPVWQRAIGLAAAAALLWALAVGLGWLITRVLTPVRDLDVAIMEWVEAQRTDGATFLAFVVDQIGDTPGIIAVLVIAAAVAHAVTRLWSAALVVVFATAGETSIFLAAQMTISRARPEIEHLAVEPLTSSFPSGHVAAAIVTYGCIALLVLSWGRGPLRIVAVAAAIVLPLAVAWSRIYQGMHFPSDVLVSMIFAPLWLAACWWAFRPIPRGEAVRVGRGPVARARTAGRRLTRSVRP